MQAWLKGAIFAVFGAVCALPAMAQSVVVVELYTSQGCSSCPPADRFLTEIAQRDDVIALGLHVDYWDYLGWEDDLAHSAFTERQAEFNTRMKSRYRLVTPQLIFHGRDYVAGATQKKRRMAADYIEKLAAEQEKAALTVVRDGTAARIVVEAVPGQSAPADVHMVRYEPSISRDIRRGENAGTKIEYTNTVTEWRTLGSWNGQSRLEKQVTLEGGDHWVVIVQTRNLGPVLAARRIE
ncbi:MAG: DUF1223 domain-containing protein [Pseudomonadota bacterium]